MVKMSEGVGRSRRKAVAKKMSEGVKREASAHRNFEVLKARGMQDCSIQVILAKMSK